MDNRTDQRVIHSYDTRRRRVLCGLPEQTNSTKHPGSVTCVTCRELLDRAAAAGSIEAPSERGA